MQKGQSHLSKANAMCRALPMFYKRLISRKLPFNISDIDWERIPSESCPAERTCACAPNSFSAIVLAFELRSFPMRLDRSNRNAAICSGVICSITFGNKKVDAKCQKHEAKNTLKRLISKLQCDAATEI